MKAISTTNVIRGGNIAFYFASPTLAAFLTFLTYELALGSLTASNVFTVLGVLQGVRLHLGYFFPVGVQVWVGSCFCSCQRSRLTLTELGRAARVDPTV